MVTCSGINACGSLRIVRNGIGTTEQASIPLPGAAPAPSPGALPWQPPAVPLLRPVAPHLLRPLPPPTPPGRAYMHPNSLKAAVHSGCLLNFIPLETLVPISADLDLETVIDNAYEQAMGLQLVQDSSSQPKSGHLVVFLSLLVAQIEFHIVHFLSAVAILATQI